MKKISAILLALVLILSMSVVAFAANDGSITISNTTIGKEYKIYKVFDATYSGENISYTYDGSDNIFLTALQNSSLFTVTVNSAGTYNVVKNASASDSDVIAFIKDNAANFGDAVDTKSGNGEAVTFSGLAYGYYYITSSLGTAVTIDSAAKDVTVVDKNEDGPSKPDKTADDKDNNSASVGDTIDYKVTGTLARYNGNTKISTYKFTDTMSDGLTFNDDVTLKIANTALTVNTDYTYTKTGNGFEIVLTTWTESDGFKYAVDAAYEITYTATVNQKAVAENAENKNDFDLIYNNDSQTEIGDSTETKVFGFGLKKTDGKDDLSGAKFTLKKGETTIYFTKADSVYTVCTSNTENATTVIEAGNVTIKGLGAGIYTLTETEAPAGYNMLTAPVTVVINEDGTLTQNGETASVITIVNNTGSELPSTGGMGTTIFYVVGGLMVAAAIVLLVAKKKASSK